MDEVKSCKQNGSTLFDEQIHTQSTHFTRVSCITYIAQSHRNTKQENRHFTIPLPIHLSCVFWFSIFSWMSSFHNEDDPILNDRLEFSSQDVKANNYIVFLSILFSWSSSS